MKTRLSSNLRQTTRECVHLVTCGHFWSRDKDDGHIQKSHAACKLHGSIFYIEARLLPNADRSFTSREYGISRWFAPVTLILTR